MILTFGGLAKEPAFQKGSVIKNDLKKAEVGRLGTAKRLVTEKSSMTSDVSKLRYSCKLLDMQFKYHSGNACKFQVSA